MSYSAGSKSIPITTREPTGFIDRQSSIITFDDGYRLFTIEPTEDSFEYYIAGKKYTFQTPQTIEIPDVEGLNYIYFDGYQLKSNSELTTYIITQAVFTAIVYWDFDNKQSIYFADERHGITMDGYTHLYLHNSVGAAYAGGLGLSGFNIDGYGDLDADVEFDVLPGAFYDEDLHWQIENNLPQKLSPAAEIPVFYKLGPNNWRVKSPDGYTTIYNGTAGYSGTRIPYNNYDGMDWSLLESAENYFVLIHVFATNNTSNPIIAVQGTHQYGRLAAARTAAGDELNTLTGLPFAEYVAIGTVILQTSEDFTNIAKSRIVSTSSGENYIDFRNTSDLPKTTSLNHGNLSGLTNADHPASAIYTAPANFSGNLSSADTDVQKALETLDALATSSLPLTDKGDLLSHDGYNPAVLDAGIDGYVLYADSTATLGIKWGDSALAGDVVGPPGSNEVHTLTGNAGTVTVVAENLTKAAGNFNINGLVTSVTSLGTGASTSISATTSGNTGKIEVKASSIEHSLNAFVYRTATSGAEEFNSVQRGGAGFGLAPTYSFSSSTASGMYVTGTALLLGFSANLRLSLGSTEAKMEVGSSRVLVDTNTATLSGDTEVVHQTGGIARRNVTTANETFTLPQRGTTGSASEPTYSFTDNTNLGVYRSAAHTLAVTTAGVLRRSISDTIEVFTLQQQGGNGTAAAPTYGFSASTTHGLYSAGVNILAASTASTERLRIDAAGQLSVGTATANELVTVEGRLSLRETAGVPATSADYGKIYAKPDKVLYFLDSDGYEFDLLAGGGGTPAGIDGQVQFNDGGIAFGADAAFHWDDTEKRLGLGTASPATRLHVVVPTTQIAVTADGPALVSGAGRALVNVVDQTAFAAGTGGGIFFTGRINAGGTLSEHASIHGGKENATSDNTAGSLVLSTRTAAGALTARRTITSTEETSTLPQRVADGTIAAPAYGFSATTHIGMYRTASNGIGFAAGLSLRREISGSDEVFYGRQRGPTGEAGNATYAFSDNHNLGVYRSAANTLGFTAAGVLRRSISDTVETFTLPQRGANGTAAAPTYSFSGSTTHGLYSAGANILAASTASTERLRIDAAGLVSIGVATANELLTVEGKLSLRAQGSAPASIVNYGKYYTLTADGRPYYIEPGASGQIHQLTKDLVQTLTWAATTNVDFSPALPESKTLTLGGNTTFGNLNLGTGRKVSLRVICDGVDRTLAFPAWHQLGAFPSTMAAGTRALLVLESFGTLAADVFASWIPEGEIPDTLVGQRSPIQTITTDGYLTIDDCTVLVDCTAGVINVTLPAVASADEFIFRVKKIDSTANVVNILSAANIDGASGQVLVAQYEAMGIQSDGTTYWVLP